VIFTRKLLAGFARKLTQSASSGGKMGRKGGHSRVDRAWSLVAPRATRNAKARRRKDARQQTVRSVAKGNDSGVTVRPSWRVICSGPQY